MSDLPKHLLRLEDALFDLPDATQAMSLAEVDGFVAGLCLLPDPPETKDWLPLVWRPEPETPDYLYHDAELLQEIADLALRHQRDIARHLHRGTYDPIFDVDEASDDLVCETWMSGFARAMSLRPETFAEIESAPDDDDAAEALEGLQLLADLSAGPEEDDAPSRTVENAESATDRADDGKVEAFRAAAPDLIPEFVATLYDWTRSKRPVPDFAVPVTSVRVGRNDPCPCGSGRKFKKCCGAAA